MDRWTQVGEVRVDHEAVRRLVHRCRPELCKGSASCCGRYEVVLDRGEVARIAGLLKAASGYARHLRGRDGLANCFEPIGRGRCALDTDESGLCTLAYRRRDRRVLCSLHSAALAAGLDPYAAKPASCVLWPLALSEDPPRTLSVMDDALDFPCNRRRPAARRGLDPGVAAAIRRVFGADFLEALLDAAGTRPKRRKT